MCAARCGNLDCLEHLVAKGAAKLEATDKVSAAPPAAPPAPSAPRRSRPLLPRYSPLLLTACGAAAAPPQDGFTALMHAAQEGELDCLELLIAKGAKLEASSNVSAAPPANPSPLSPLSGPPPSLLAACAALRSPPPLTACAATPPRLRRTASRPS